MENSGLLKTAIITFAFHISMVTAATAQAFTKLADFGGIYGSNPGPLTQGPDGDFYGTTMLGPGLAYGTVFKVTPNGALTTLYQFCSLPNCADGGEPVGRLLLATDGNFYGTTSIQGADGNAGTVFKMTPSGVLTTLHSFCAQPNCADGDAPVAGLMEASDGNFYGTTIGGGSYGWGSVFKITPQGALTTLHSFNIDVDGYQPSVTLLEGGNGRLFGTTIFGYGPVGLGPGTIFEMTLAGSFKTVYEFCSQVNCADGSNPNGGLIQLHDGNLYGTTGSGGADKDGVAFTINSEGRLTTLFNFDSTDGTNPEPYSPLLLGTDGTLYGTTAYGGTDNWGTIFEMTPLGKLRTLYNFCNCGDGANVSSGVIQGTNGTFYGTAEGGGANPNSGTFFSVATGLPPFIETLPAIRRAGAPVIILGNNLTGTSAVSFNGVPAKFSVASDTEVKTIVPAAATTGFVTVTTSGGVLTSNKKFKVIP